MPTTPDATYPTNPKETAMSETTVRNVTMQNIPIAPIDVNCPVCEARRGQSCSVRNGFVEPAHRSRQIAAVAALAERDAQLQAVRDLADEWEAMYDRWSGVSDGPRVAIFRAHATRLRAALTQPAAADERGEG